MTGRKLTWYKPNGLVKSRINRVLVSKEWIEAWPHCKQHVLSRSISDHCAIIIKNDYVDWGSKLFRSLDVWQSDSIFKVFLKERCSKYEVQGGGIYIFKENLKKLKANLKVWNRKVFGDVNKEGDGLLKRIRELDARDDDFDLNEHEREEKKRAKNELHGVFENGRWSEDKDEVKDKVRDFFEARFVGNDELPVRLDNVCFNSISEEDNQMLVEAFS
ncbi:uncharacterized protein [Phaseolus vulgaris]|uniref:uncharacterized protein n=1 Tax=Phaseolus vulgaris TaxID=3885 RepID=UPI0035C9827C